MSILTDDDLRVLFSEIDVFDWQKDFDVTIRDFLLESNLCASDEEIYDEFRIGDEIESRKITINNIPIDDPQQVFQYLIRIYLINKDEPQIKFIFRFLLMTGIFCRTIFL